MIEQSPIKQRIYILSGNIGREKRDSNEVIRIVWYQRTGQ